MKTSITQKYSDIRTFNVDRCSDSSQRHRRERRFLSWRSSSTKCCRLMSDAGTARKGKPVHTDTDALFKHACFSVTEDNAERFRDKQLEAWQSISRQHVVVSVGLTLACLIMFEPLKTAVYVCKLLCVLSSFCR